MIKRFQIAAAVTQVKLCITLRYLAQRANHRWSTSYRKDGRHSKQPVSAEHHFRQVKRPKDKKE